MILFPFGISGGEKIRILRKRRNWSQEQLAEAAGTTRNHISTIETGYKSGQGTEPRPSEDMLGRILAALDARFSERRSVFESFTYSMRTPRPKKKEIAWACEVFHKELVHVTIPAYLLDCALRLHTWNAYIPPAIMTSPEILNQFAGEYLVRIYDDPRIKFADKIANREEFFAQNRRALYQHILLYMGEDWVEEVIEAYQILDLEQAMNTEVEIPARPQYQLHLDHGDNGILKFWVMREPMVRDDRFYVLYLMPANEDVFARACQPIS